MLKHIGYLSQRNTVELKGKVACELHSHEVLLTELLFQNVFDDFQPGEIAALLSSLVFQQVSNVVNKLCCNLWYAVLQCNGNSRGSPHEP